MYVTLQEMGQFSELHIKTYGSSSPWHTMMTTAKPI